MDFELTELEREIGDLAESLMKDYSSAERLLELEESGNRLDPDLWGALREAGLTTVGIAEDHGGAGLGFGEACVVFEKAGKATAAVPVLCHTVGLHALQRARATPELGEFAVGDGWLAVSTRVDRGNSLRFEDGKVRGEILPVPYAVGARAFLVPVRDGEEWTLCLIRSGQAGETLEPQVSTDKSPAARLVLAGVAATKLGERDLVDWTRQRLITGISAVQSGVVEEAIRMTVAYISEREAFGVKIGAFQAVSQRMADAYIDLMTLQLLSRNAASVLAKEDDGLVDALSAKLMAGDAGHRVLHVCQQVHGGIGHDRGYPLWRYTVAAKQNELATISSAEAVAELGKVIATDPGRVTL